MVAMTTAILWSIGDRLTVTLYTDKCRKDFLHQISQHWDMVTMLTIIFHILSQINAMIYAEYIDTYHYTVNPIVL